jgi:hypothetical protein
MALNSAAPAILSDISSDILSAISYEQSIDFFLREGLMKQNITAIASPNRNIFVAVFQLG